LYFLNSFIQFTSQLSISELDITRNIYSYYKNVVDFLILYSFPSFGSLNKNEK